MGTNFSSPFVLTPQGGVSKTTNPNVISENRVECLIGTNPGERVMLPAYGVDLQKYLFTPDVVENSNMVSNDITQAMSSWEPSLTLLNIIPTATQDNSGLLNISVEYTISSDPTITPALTATVMVGGKVVNL